MKLDELTLSTDHKAVLVDIGCWVELPQAVETIAFITPRCEGCKKETFLPCIQLGIEDRKAGCEMLEEVKVFENMSVNPMPQPGQLYQEYLAKNAPTPVVVEEPKPEPPKKSFVDKILGRV